MLTLVRKYQFLFEELVKRDFKQKYKRTVLGMAWSVLSPLCQLLVMSVVFTQFFGRSQPHYTIYLFCGNLVYNYFREATSTGMFSLMSNSGIITKVNVPKYMFLLSKSISSLINFGLTLLVFFLFVAIDGLPFAPRFLALVYPVACLIVFNIGVGLVLSALFVFFRDINYLYDVFCLMLMYLSAIFYTVDSFDPGIEKLFLLNPIYCYIKYFRVVVIDGNLPSIPYHLLCLLYAVIMVVIGGIIYKKFNHKFLYYM